MVSLAGESGTSMDEVDMEAGNPDGSLTSPSEERESEVLRISVASLVLMSCNSLVAWSTFTWREVANCTRIL